MIDLEAIRARVEARRLSAPSRRRLRPEERDCDKLLAYVDELREAAGKVECMCCAGSGRREIYERGDLIGEYPPIGDEPCPDCADLSRLMGESHE